MLYVKIKMINCRFNVVKLENIKFLKLEVSLCEGEGVLKDPRLVILKIQLPRLILKKSRFHFVQLSFSKKQVLDVEGLQPHTLIHLRCVLT